MKPTRQTLEALRRAHPALTAAEGAVLAASLDVEAAKEALRARQRDADRVPADVARGRAGADALGPAVVAVRAAALAIPKAEGQLAEAQAALSRVVERALAAVAASIRTRREKLRAALPTTMVKDLEKVVDAERALVTEAAGIRDEDQRELLVDRDLGEPLSWPPSFSDQVALANRLFANVPSPAACHELDYPTKKAVA